jgi:hypothetical protein
VTIAVGLFFAVFGTIVVDGELAKTWAGGTPDMIGSTTILGVQLSLSDQTLVVAAAVAALSGLYYAIAVFTDSTYREEFLGEVTGEMRATFAARDAYLAVIREEPQGA